MAPDVVISGLPLANPTVGQGVYARRLVAGLARRIGPRVLVVAPSWVERPAEIEPANFVSMQPLPIPHQATVRQVLGSEQLLRYVGREYPDAVFHSPGPIMGSTRPEKTVVTLHDCIYRHFPNYGGRFGNRRLLLNATKERFAARASLVLTDSEFSKRDLIVSANIPEAWIEVLYPWVGPEYLAPIDPAAVSAFRIRLGLPERFWLYLGGYDYRKNVEFLINAYAAAGKSRQLPRLVLAGTLPTKRNPAMCNVRGVLQETGIDPLAPGVISVADLPLLYRAASLLIYPSLMEGFGLPPAEAIAVGTPVLSANNSSLPEVVRKEECLFDATQTNSLVTKLLAAASDEGQFQSDLPADFLEAHGIARYLRIIEQRFGLQGRS